MLVLFRIFLLCSMPVAHSFMIDGQNWECDNYMNDFGSANSNPTIMTKTMLGIYVCDYNKQDYYQVNMQLPACYLKCPIDSQLISFNPETNKVTFLSSAQYEGFSWFGQPVAGGQEVDLGDTFDRVTLESTMQFGCTIRCGAVIDGDGVQHPSKCNAKDTNAVCNEDGELPMCTCGPGYTGATCGATIEMYERIDTWLGPEEAKKLLDLLTISRTSPVALVSLMPSIYAMLPVDKKIAMGFSMDEMIDSLDYELREVNTTKAFTQVFDDQLGNCFTFNYANKTNEGRYSTRFAGQYRDFNIILKFDPSEQAAWVESSSISTYIHAPGTPPEHGILYSVRGGASDLVSLRKIITRLNYGCISSLAELKQTYYDDGDYTREGCYAACYQDKVLEKCGCMDARMKKASSARQCDFKDNDCITAVSAEYGGATTWSNCVCLPECYKEVYAISATRGALPFKLPDCGNATHCPDPTQSTARLTIYMESLESEVYVEEAKITFITLLSNLGGQLGFMLGISVVGAIEVAVLCAQLGKEQCPTKHK